MKSFVVVLASVLPLIVLSEAAFAEDEEYAREGFYVAGIGLAAFDTFDLGRFDPSTAGGFNVRAGYRLMERLSFEVQFEYADGFNDSPVNVDTWNFMGNVKGFILTDRIQPYALFGMGVMSVEATLFGLSREEEDFAIRVGGGIDTYVSENWVFTIESAWIKPTDELEDWSYVTLGAGVQYRF